MHSTHPHTVRSAGLIKAGAALAVLALAACSSVPPPREQMAVSRASVDRAVGTAGAEAPVEVAAARDKLARAQRAMAEKDYGLARRLAEEAEADANLADAKSRSTRADSALEELRASIRALRAEISRS